MFKPDITDSMKAWGCVACAICALGVSALALAAVAAVAIDRESIPLDQPV